MSDIKFVNTDAEVLVVAAILPFGFVVKFQRRTLSTGVNADDDDADDDAAADMMTVFFTTFEMIEQLLNDAELRTLGEAVILMGTVQVALNDADRWTCPSTDGDRGAGELPADTSDSALAIDCATVWVVVGGAAVGFMGGVKGAIDGLRGSCFGDGVHELSLC